VELMLWCVALHPDNVPPLMTQNLLDDGNQGRCGCYYWSAKMEEAVLVFLQYDSDISVQKETEDLKQCQQRL
jgi:hypothetical protein